MQIEFCEKVWVAHVGVITALLDGTELRDCMRGELALAKSISMAMAMITKRGLETIEEPLTNCLKRGGTCRVLFGTDLPTEPQAIARLIRISKEFDGQLELRSFQPVDAGIFHPKLVIFRRSSGSMRCLVGSANLTYAALNDNCEATVFVTDISTCKRMTRFFEDWFWGSESDHVDPDWLRAYRTQWKLQRRFLKQLERMQRIQPLIRISKRVPTRVAGHRFAITGRLSAWTRGRITNLIERLGGKVLDNPQSIHGVDCLVKGDFVHGSDTSAKFQGALESDIPQITEQTLCRIIEREKTLRKRSQRS